jgi:hypothetical protein
MAAPFRDRELTLCQWKAPLCEGITQTQQQDWSAASWEWGFPSTKMTDKRSSYQIYEITRTFQKSGSEKRSDAECYRTPISQKFLDQDGHIP